MIEILDCTLRDGGYYNNWDFSNDLVKTYLQSMEKLPVTCLEVGYRNNTGRLGYHGKYFYTPEFVLSWIKELAPSKRIAIMFNEKEVLPGDVKKLLAPCKGLIDVVRLAVAPTRFKQALELAETIKNLGFEVAFNLMYMSSLLANEDVLQNIGQLEGKVDFFSLVDSYGSVYPDDVTRLVSKCKSLTNVPIGFHGHNNIELVFANSLAAINAGCSIVDATITGMGRGAGNLKTELILTHLATKEGLDVDFNALGDVVSEFEELQQEYQWGTSLPYMVSGANSLPQSDVMDWVSKRSYSINSIIRGLDNQSKGQKDNLKLPLFKADRSFKSALIIGGGNSAIDHVDAIKKFVAQHEDICLIHASSKNSWAYADVAVPQFFCLVGNEGHRMEKVFTHLNDVDAFCVLPPYPRRMGTYIPEIMEKRSNELEQISFTDIYLDSHTVLALQTAIDLSVDSVYVVGYDGYAKTAISSNEQGLFNENEHSFSRFNALNQQLHSLTPSLYKGLKLLSVYSLVE